MAALCSRKRMAALAFACSARELHLAAVAGDLGADDLAALHLAALGADRHRAAGDGLVLRRT